MSLNRSVNTDAQSRSAAAPRRSLVAGYVRRYRSKMKEVVAHALAPGMALRLAVAFESGWRHGPRNALALGLHAGGHRSGGLQRHSAPARRSVEEALEPQRFSGGAFRVFGRAVSRRGATPAAFQYRRALAGSVAASCASVGNSGLALAGAASDNKSVNTDAQGRPAALPRRSLVAGYLQR